MVLMITYDLNKIKDYNKLYKAIKILGETKRDSNLDSVWFVSTTSSPTTASNYLKNVVDNDDVYFICRVRSGERDGWMDKKVWNWIESHE